MTTLHNIITARKFTESYLGYKFKDNDEFYRNVFEEWWYKTSDKIPLGDFLRKKYFGDDKHEE